jgi:hypothetical protein
LEDRLTVTGHLREDETFVISCVAKAFCATSRPGENPPDAYLSIGVGEVAVEISTLTQHVTDNRGTRERNSDDFTAINLANELDDELRDLITSGHTIFLTLCSPILKRRKTQAKLVKMLRAQLPDVQSFTKHTVIEINGNTITIFRNNHGDSCRKRVCGVVMHRQSNPDILCNTCYILEDRIKEKAEKCAGLVGRIPLWLALRNDCYLTDPQTYKDALSFSCPVHPFERILLVSGDGSVASLFEHSEPNPGTQSAHPVR